MCVLRSDFYLMCSQYNVRVCCYSMLQDSTSALFLAVNANEYSVASELIQKGAFVDAVKVMYICLLYVCM